MESDRASRNKREGGYLGRYRCIWDESEGKLRRRHHRKGRSTWSTLRQWKKGEHG